MITLSKEAQNIIGSELYKKMQKLDNTPSYDYKRQAWTLHGVYIPCNHPPQLNCKCYGKQHAGEKKS